MYPHRDTSRSGIATLHTAEAHPTAQVRKGAAEAKNHEPVQSFDPLLGEVLKDEGFEECLLTPDHKQEGQATSSGTFQRAEDTRIQELQFMIERQEREMESM